MEATVQINRKQIHIVERLIVLATVIINLVPYLYVLNTPFWMLQLLFDNSFLYYLSVVLLMYFPIGTVISAIVGNKNTGLCTFAFSSICYLVMGDVVNIVISFCVVMICLGVYYNGKLSNHLKFILTIVLVEVAVVGALNLWKLVNVNRIEEISVIISSLIVGLLVLSVSVLLERIPKLQILDVDRKGLDRNYRVHSINRKLMIIINVICAVLILIVSVLFMVLLTQSGQEKESAEEVIWESIIRREIVDDADIYTNHDMDLIKSESSRIQKAFEDSYISVPAYVYITTALTEDQYIRQTYMVEIGDIDSDAAYEVQWVEEKEISINDISMAIIKPDPGESMVTVSVSSQVDEYVKKALANALAIGLIVIALVNVFVEKFIRKNIVRPINQMTTEAINFAFGSDDFEKLSPSERESVRKDRVEINSGDEIESLNQAINKTMDDVEDYIDRVREKSKQVSDMQHNIIVTMADIIESRDLNTGGHIKRTAVYVGIIARKLMSDGMFPDTLTREYLEDMIVAAPLHDMGKIHVPDNILNKNGRLTDEEFDIMKSHAAVGRELLDVASDSLGEFRYLAIAKQMAESHHEWWNGAGYPEKLDTVDIPLCARIMAVADVFDALVSKRCYKEPMDLDIAFGIIEKESGTHFDPVVAQAFLDCRPEVEAALSELSGENK